VTNDSKPVAETRDVTVGSSVQRHQLKQWLNAQGIDWRSWPISMTEGGFRITASPAQWEGINQWLQRTKVGP
jgi:hypothetical protein